MILQVTPIKLVVIHPVSRLYTWILDLLCVDFGVPFSQKKKKTTKRPEILHILKIQVRYTLSNVNNWKRNFGKENTQQDTNPFFFGNLFLSPLGFS